MDHTAGLWDLVRRNVIIYNNLLLVISDYITLNCYKFCIDTDDNVAKLKEYTVQRRNFFESCEQLTSFFMMTKKKVGIALRITEN